MAFVMLGLWQLSREDEKREYLALLKGRLNQPPIPAHELPEDGDINGLPVAIRGKFDEQMTLLLDNRVLKGRVGFEVHQLFRDESGIALLVNRGFVQMGRTRANLPPVPPVVYLPGKAPRLLGRVYQPDGDPWLMRETPAVQGGFPANAQHIDIVQHIDIAQLQVQTGLDIYPLTVRLEENQPGALPRHWPATVMSPARHRGYAIQWFALAATVVAAWLFFSFRKEEQSHD